MSEFIFMLTRNDETIPDARAVYASVADLGLQHVGCKDVGLPKAELAALIADIRAHGHTSYLEVVSESDDSMEVSARTAVDVGADYVIGGTAVERIQKVIAGTGMKFFPYIGSIVGHPCLLRGSIHDIVEDAKRVEQLGVDGINLLAYRYDADVPELVRSVAAATALPLICAGSVDSVQRIEALRDLGVWAFTIGTAALDGAFAPGKPLEDQLRVALAVGS
jgi:NAD(P)H-dependent flavin oxidoreductase YrpB (nitropropane dioxygenase family)